MQIHDGRMDAAAVPHCDILMPLQSHNHELVMGDTDIAERLRKDSFHDEHIVLRSVEGMHSNVEAMEVLIDVVGLLTLQPGFRSHLLHSTFFSSLQSVAVKT